LFVVTSLEPIGNELPNRTLRRNDVWVFLIKISGKRTV
jgi:hypothetical protein